MSYVAVYNDLKQYLHK